MDGIEYNKTFRFTLEQDGIVLYERIFNGEVVSPYTRNSVDIRPCLHDLIREIQRGLSLKEYNHTYTVNEKVVYDFYEKYITTLDNYKEFGYDEMLYRPESRVKKIEDKEIRGVYCKLNLFINENLIVEREFYVDNFNPKCRWSADLIHLMDGIVNKIRDKIIKKDKKNIWDDYDIINRTGMTIAQVRTLTTNERTYWLRRINN